MPESERARLRTFRHGFAGIPTLEEWKRQSATSRFDVLNRRGSPEIRAIDSAVEEYNRRAVAPGAPTSVLWQAAVDLLEAIEVYLATGRGHKQPRVDAVNDLRGVTKTTLAQLRWKKLQEVTGFKADKDGKAKPVKPMVPHVWSEMHSPGHARVGHDPNLPNEPDEWLNNAAAWAADKKDKEVGKHKYLFQYLKHVREANGDKPDNVTYIEDSNRWKYQITFSPGEGRAGTRFSVMGGGVLETPTPLTTKGGGLSTAPYAVDENGIFYTETHQGGALLNHCSFLSGRPVMCAGMIGITDGVVGYIDNASGHYRPSKNNLLRCLQALKDVVPDLTFKSIIVRNHASANPNDAYLAPKFLAARGVCLPDGYYDSFGHYKTDFKVLDKAERQAHFSKQEQTRTNEALVKKLKNLIMKLESNKIKDPNAPPDNPNNKILSGILDNDEDRNIMVEAVRAGLAPDHTHKRYYVNDAKVLQMLAQQPGGQGLQAKDGLAPKVAPLNPAPAPTHRRQVEEKLKALKLKLEMSVVTGKLDNDEDRKTMQEALKLGIAGFQALNRYFANDEAMKEWVKTFWSAKKPFAHPLVARNL